MSQVLRLSLPLTVWLVAFSAVYGLHGLVCAGTFGTVTGPGDIPLGRILLIAAWGLSILAHAALLAALASDRYGGPPGFMRRTTLVLAIVALVAVVWTLAPVAVLSLCDGRLPAA